MQPKLPRYVRCLPGDALYALRHLLINVIGGSPLLPKGGRILVYNLSGIRADRAVIYPHIKFLNRGPVRIARDVMLNSGITFENRGPIDIERSVSIGPEVYIGTATHAVGPSNERAGAPRALPVRIGAGTWIGARAIILPGVTIGAGCVIAAGSVVPNDCEPNFLYAGVPARKVRALSDDESRATVATS